MPLPTRLGVVAVTVVSALAVGLGAQRAAVNQRVMWVSVLDQAGKPVPDLKPDDFLIRVDGLKREVLTAEPATDPMQIAVLADTSQAARDYIGDIRNGLRAFAHEVAGANELALMGVGERPTLLSDYSTSAAQFEKGVDRVFANTGSGSYLLDGLIDVSRGHKKREAARPVIVAVTTEGPELSGRFHDQVLTPITDNRAAFHAVLIGPPSTDILSSEARERNFVLGEGTSGSGGHLDRVLSGSALPQKLTELATELTHQYRVTYGMPQTLIPPQHYDVSVMRPGVTARGTPAREPNRP